MSFRPLIPVYTANGYPLWEDTWVERGAHLANVYAHRFFQRREWLDWEIIHAETPLGRRIAELSARDEWESLYTFLDQVYNNPDTLDAELRDDASMTSLVQLLDCLRIGLDEADRTGVYRAARDDRQEALGIQMKTLGDANALLDDPDRARLEEYIRRVHGIALDAVPEDMAPDDSAHKRELRTLDILGSIEKDKGDVDARLRSAALAWINRNPQHVRIEHLVTKRHGFDVVVDIAKCHDIARNPATYFPEWRTTQPYLGFVNALVAAMEGYPESASAAREYDRRVMRLLTLDIARLDRLIEGEPRPIVARPDVTMQEESAAIPVVESAAAAPGGDAQAVTLSEVPAADPGLSTSRADEVEPSGDIETITPVPSSPIPAPEPSKTPVVTTVATKPEKPAVSKSQGWSRADLLWSLVLPRPGGSARISTSAKTTPSTPRISLDYTSLTTEEKVAAVKSVLRLLSMTLSGWGMRRFESGMKWRTYRKMRDTAFMTFVSAIRSGNADGVVAGVFSLCRHLFDAQPEAAAACRCSQVLGLAAGSCARGWKEAVSELPEHVSVSVALEKLIANSDKPEERISSLIAEYDTAHAKKETIAKTAAPLANVVAPTRAPDVASVTVGGHRAVMDNVVGAVAAVTKSGETTFATSTRADVENRINGVCSVLRDKGVVNKNLSGELIKAGILATSMYRLYTLLHQEGFGTADLTSQSNPSFKRNWKQINKPTLEACVTKLFAGILRLAA